MKKTITFTPFTRLEGNMKIELRIEAGRVAEAFASGTLYRGFESILKGRSPMDALVITCRVCGHCGAAHSAASSSAIAHMCAVDTPPNAVLCRNIIQGAELLLSHLTHFYLSFMPQFGVPENDEVLASRFASMTGTSFRKAFRARSQFLALLGIVAGKWPNTLAIQPGGTTKTLNSGEISRASGVITEFRTFLEENLFGCGLDEWLSVDSVTELESWLETEAHRNRDLGVFLVEARKAGLERIGISPGRFLSAGGFLDPGSGSLLFRSGYYDGRCQELNLAEVTEHIKHSWYEAEDEIQFPTERTADVNLRKKGAYTWSKAPRYQARSAEVGPLARMVVDEDPLAMDLIRQSPPGVLARVLMRVHEMARVATKLEEWLGQIDTNEPFFVKAELRDSASFALEPAPRGVLGHWIEIEKGLVKNYRIITPTAWNFSPRDANDHPGPVEEALIQTPVEGESDTKNIRHIVNSFDPCLYCSVH